MSIDEAEDILSQLLDFYGRKAMTTTAKKFWVKGLVRYHRSAAVKALMDVWDGYTTMPTRLAFVSACASRQAEMFPVVSQFDADVEPWEQQLGAAVIVYFNRFMEGLDSLDAWANNFRAIARQQGVENRIDWTAWEKIGARFYV